MPAPCTCMDLLMFYEYHCDKNSNTYALLEAYSSSQPQETRGLSAQPLRDSFTWTWVAFSSCLNLSWKGLGVW